MAVIRPHESHIVPKIPHCSHQGDRIMTQKWRQQMYLRFEKDSPLQGVAVTVASIDT